jgi:ABC-2 type transport system permease protein
MRGVWLIAGREFRAYLLSPIAYGVIAVFLALCGFFFFQHLADYSLKSLQFQFPGTPELLAMLHPNQQILQPLFDQMSIFLLFITPLLTMRLIAEERRVGSFDLLRSYPLTVPAIVIGKYLAALGVLVLMLALTWAYPLLLGWLGRPDLPAAAVGYLGLCLVGAAFAAIGCFASALTDKQVLAAAVAFFCSSGLWLAEWPARNTTGVLKTVLTTLSMRAHLLDFFNGMVVTSHVLFYASCAVFWLFLAIQVTEGLRWR